MALQYPHLNPVALQIGPLAIRWYGLAYITGLVLGWRYTVWLARQKRFNGPGSRPTATDLDDFLFWAMAGVLIGGRMGIVLFYQPSKYFADPISIFKVWEGGMSFHGGLIGVITALVLFARKRRIPFLHLSDLVACATPIGLFFGRLANFVNGELWGRVTNVAWAMIFPRGGPLPRHPSQLYEAGLEGVVLFIILALMIRGGALKRPGLILGSFIFFYALARIFGEFFREPDAQLGFLWGGLTMGMLLSVPMIVAGLILMILAWRKPPKPAPNLTRA
jgi:phosphatidylglycerol:prolipoprotein diacylglycerol transferase